MQVLMVAGEDGAAIVDSIENKLKSAGIQIYSETSTDNMEELYSSGGWYEKIVVLELGITNNGIDVDEHTIREKVSKFVSVEKEIGTLGRSYVFVAFSKENASIIDEELTAISDNSVVLVLEDKLKSTFLISLVRDDIEKIRSLYEDKVYKPIEKVVVKPIKEKKDTVGIKNNYNLNYGNPLDNLFDDDNDDNFGKNVQFNSQKRNDIDDLFNGETEFEGEQLNENFIEGEEEFEGEEEDFNTEIDDFNSETDSFNNGIDDFNNGVDRFDNNGMNGFDNNDFYSDDNNTSTQYNTETEQETNFDNGEQENNVNSYANDQNTWNSMYEDDGQTTGNTQGNGYDSFSDDMYNEYNPELDNYSRQTNNDYNNTTGFENDYYTGEKEVVVTNNQKQKKEKQNTNGKQVRKILNAFANRGNSILITGCGGCGVSTIALNLANTVNNLGYTVLLVDLDTENKAQSYISKENYDCIDPESASVRAAINSTSGINAHVSVVREGFHLLTMGMASDSIKFDKAIQKEKISRFINMAKTSHNFVIYDCPFDIAVGYGSEFTNMADNIVITVDFSNWGVTKTMLRMCNLESDELEENLFGRGELLFNKYKPMNRIMGRKVKTADDVARAMDYKVRELIGEDPEYYFQAMNICGVLNYDTAYEVGWFNNTQYSDTKEGSKVYVELLTNIVLTQ